MDPAIKAQKFYINFLGCEKRKLDTQRILNYMRENGWKWTQNVHDAEVVIFLTCAFCQKYEDWAVSKLEKIARNMQEGAKLIVGGCLTEIHPERLDIFPNVILIHTRDLNQLDELLTNKIPISSIPDPNTTVFDSENKTRDKSEKFNTPARDAYEDAKLGFKVRITWGCVGNCSYCVTKLATKELTSKPFDLVIEEVGGGVEKGEKSIFITGGDTGAYGIDIKTNVVSLIEKILAIPGVFKIHFQDFGIHWVRKYLNSLITVLKKHPEKLGSWCFPIQSGSNSILKSMNRPYKIEDILESLKKLKEEVPNLQIGTHFILGFPGETEDDFRQTLHFFEMAPLDFLNVFRYTDHIRAESYHFPNKISMDVILKRETEMEIIFYKKFDNNRPANDS